MKDKVLKFVLKNALQYGGSVNPKAVLGLVLRENPEFKKDVPGTLKAIQVAANHTATLTHDQIKAQLQELAPELLIEKKKEVVKGPLKALRNATMGKVVVRIAPSPSGALHIGHAYGSSLNALYAKMYGGKFILRIEDTNPENIYAGAYKMIEEDARWITQDNIEKVYVQSDRVKIYHKYAEKLVEMDKAYVCTCDANKWREDKNNGIACPCRTNDKDENLERYKKMFKEYAEGEAILRLKTDIKHKNPAMRDFGLLRINDHLHPRTKKENRVWPLMVFSVAIDDHELGLTHVLNGKDQADNAKKEKLIMDCFGWDYPQYQHWGFINFIGFKLSSSETRKAIEQNEYTGWDDIRIPFLPALRRRGYQPGAFHRFASEIGLSLNDKTVGMEEFWKMVNAFNKEIVDPTSNRYFFVGEPVQKDIIDAPEMDVELDLHPDESKRGQRILKAKGNVFIDQNDSDLEEGKIHRLMDYCNIEVKGDVWSFHSEEFETFKGAKNRGSIIHWLPIEEDYVEVTVKLQDNTDLKGIGEKKLGDVKVGDIVQLERFAFARVDEKGKNHIKLWYLHR